jgi:hypothetical protein
MKLSAILNYRSMKKVNHSRHVPGYLNGEEKIKSKKRVENNVNFELLAILR